MKIKFVDHRALCHIQATNRAIIRMAAIRVGRLNHCLLTSDPTSERRLVTKLLSLNSISIKHRCSPKRSKCYTLLKPRLFVHCLRVLPSERCYWRASACPAVRQSGCEPTRTVAGWRIRESSLICDRIKRNRAPLFSGFTPRAQKFWFVSFRNLHVNHDL